MLRVKQAFYILLSKLQDKRLHKWIFNTCSIQLSLAKLINEFETPAKVEVSFGATVSLLSQKKIHLNLARRCFLYYSTPCPAYLMKLSNYKSYSRYSKLSAADCIYMFWQRKPLRSVWDYVSLTFRYVLRFNRTNRSFNLKKKQK